MKKKTQFTIETILGGVRLTDKVTGDYFDVKGREDGSIEVRSFPAPLSIESSMSNVIVLRPRK